ncbi:cytochrome B5-like protein isoform X1 [Frieseomelitta varia]|nr:cytochrome B5-like protein isoform X1 [Frieseomelitta varia]
MEDDQRIERKNSETAIKTMSLLGLTFRSLAIGDSEPRPDDFLDLENRDSDEPSKQSRRNAKQASREDARSSNKSRDEIKRLRVINLDEVAWHDTIDSCWVVIHDFVYDCTELLKNHPGGYDVILEYAGRDATLAFIGTGHSSSARESLEKYLIGELPFEERIFRVPNGIKLVGS